MRESPQDRIPQPRGEDQRECSQLIAEMEQITRNALRRTQGWKTPPGYETAYWNEERESIARVAVWSACLSYKPNSNVPFSMYAFFKAVQAIRQEHRLAWRWSTSTVPLHSDQAATAFLEPLDPEWRKPFQQCEDDYDLQLLLEPLPETDRQLLYWCYQDGLTEREIAQRLNLSKTAVHKRLARLRRKLQDVLNERDTGG